MDEQDAEQDSDDSGSGFVKEARIEDDAVVFAQQSLRKRSIKTKKSRGHNTLQFEQRQTRSRTNSSSPGKLPQQSPYKTPIVHGNGPWETPARAASPTPHDPRSIVPGTVVLRRRPASTILRNSSDQDDRYDGPWKVLEVKQREPAGNRSTPSSRRFPAPKPMGRLAIPSDSVLYRKCKGWVHLSQLVKTNLSTTESDNEGASVVIEGVEMWVVKKVRGSAYDGQDAVTGERKIKYLVHWAGYPSEDDTWQHAEGDVEGDEGGGVPIRFIEDWVEREQEWRKGMGYED